MTDFTKYLEKQKSFDRGVEFSYNFLKVLHPAWSQVKSTAVVSFTGDVPEESDLPVREPVYKIA